MRREYWGYFSLVALTVFVTRLPFLNAGYGLDPDAWRVAKAARIIASERSYSVSRLPGYPIHEIVSALLWRGGPLALNAATAIMSGVAVAFFGLSICALGYRDHLAACAALAMTPVVFLGSVEAKDHLWELAFVMGSLYALLCGRSILSGVALGLAIGCRITSIGMLFPFLILIAERNEADARLHPAFRFSLAAILIGGVNRLPVIVKYGWGAFSFADHGYPPIPLVLHRLTIEAWGVLGMIGWGIAGTGLILNIWRRIHPSQDAPPISRPHSFPWIIVVVIYLLGFLRLPHHSAYLIPAIPFLILLMANFLDRGWFLVFCGFVGLSPFFLSIDIPLPEENPPFPTSVRRATVAGRKVVWSLREGPIFLDHARRLNRMRLLRKVIEEEREAKTKRVTVAGWLLPELELSLPVNPNPQVEYVYLLDHGQARDYLDRGFEIFHLWGQEEFSRAVLGADSSDADSPVVTMEKGKENQ